MSVALVAVATSAIWLYLILGRGFFWRAAERDDDLAAPPPAVWPSVTAIVPARNEAEVIAQSLGSLFRQTYPGKFDIVLVDDESSDGTAQVAREAAARTGAADRLTIMAGSAPPAGWTGKLFAMNLGLRRVEAEPRPPEYVLFTDADIAYAAPDAVERLVKGAEARRAVLVSLMVKLRCESLAERLLVPAFVFFFDKLYPFAWVNDPRSKVAAAAGGCMLVRREALTKAGGLQAIHGALIDDCALAGLLKREGPIWLGLTERVVSLRPYPRFADIRRMVVRSAFAELRYSPWRLGGTLAGMSLIYLAPPLLAVFADGLARWLGLAAWLAMALAFQPMLRLYRRSPLWGIALPAVAAIYTAFTLESAIRVLARSRWRMEGPLPGNGLGRRNGRLMITATEARSGKGHTDENFPVASRLIQSRHRAPILAFYRFVRAADDIADHPKLAPDEKLRMLDRLDEALTGRGPSDPEAEPLKSALAERGLSARHALDLLDAFRMDATKLRYADWRELMHYCSLSAMPVGRFVLDVHGETPQTTWPASDAICAALQVVNHLQDCGTDYRNLDRVYLPLDTLSRYGARVEDLGEAQATAGLRAAIAALADRSLELLSDGALLADRVTDTRLAMEIAAIRRLSVNLATGLKHRDPLKDKVRHGRAGFALIALVSAAGVLLRRPFVKRAVVAAPAGTRRL